MRMTTCYLVQRNLWFLDFPYEVYPLNNIYPKFNFVWIFPPCKIRNKLLLNCFIFNLSEPLPLGVCIMDSLCPMSYSLSPLFTPVVTAAGSLCGWSDSLSPALWCEAKYLHTCSATIISSNSWLIEDRWPQINILLFHVLEGQLVYSHGCIEVLVVICSMTHLFPDSPIPALYSWSLGLLPQINYLYQLLFQGSLD